MKSRHNRRIFRRHRRRRTTLLAALAVIVAGCLITVLVLGVRATFGLFLEPMSSDFGWGREVFALSMAIQNLMWGLGQPFAGAIADRYGTAKVLTGGLLIYAAGLFLMAEITITDPVYLAEPITFSHRWRKLADRDVIQAPCTMEAAMLYMQGGRGGKVKK